MSEVTIGSNTSGPEMQPGENPDRSDQSASAETEGVDEWAKLQSSIFAYLDAQASVGRVISMNRIRETDMQVINDRVRQADITRRQYHDAAARIVLSMGLVPRLLPVPGRDDASEKDQIEEGWREARKLVEQMAEKYRPIWSQRQARN